MYIVFAGHRQPLVNEIAEYGARPDPQRFAEDVPAFTDHGTAAVFCRELLDSQLQASHVAQGLLIHPGGIHTRSGIAFQDGLCLGGIRQRLGGGEDLGGRYGDDLKAEAFQQLAFVDHYTEEGLGADTDLGDARTPQIGDDARGGEEIPESIPERCVVHHAVFNISKGDAAAVESLAAGKEATLGVRCAPGKAVGGFVPLAPQQQGHLHGPAQPQDSLLLAKVAVGDKQGIDSLLPEPLDDSVCRMDVRHHAVWAQSLDAHHLHIILCTQLPGDGENAVPVGLHGLIGKIISSSWRHAKD